MSTDWRHDAWCRDRNPELWFGPKDSERGQDLRPWELAAKQACRQHCPVVAECAAWAIGSGQEYGVFGGLAAQERRQKPLRRAS